MSTLQSPGTTKLRIGISLANIDPDGSPTAILETAIAAENAGIDAVFLPDHVLHLDRAFADPLVALAAIAAITNSAEPATAFSQRSLTTNRSFDAISEGFGYPVQTLRRNHPCYPVPQF